MHGGLGHLPTIYAFELVVHTKGHFDSKTTGMPLPISLESLFLLVFFTNFAHFQVCAWMKRENNAKTYQYWAWKSVYPRRPCKYGRYTCILGKLPSTPVISRIRPCFLQKPARIKNWERWKVCFTFDLSDRSNNSFKFSHVWILWLSGFNNWNTTTGILIKWSLTFLSLPSFLLEDEERNVCSATGEAMQIPGSKLHLQNTTLMFHKAAKHCWILSFRITQPKWGRDGNVFLVTALRIAFLTTNDCQYFLMKSKERYHT